MFRESKKILVFLLVAVVLVGATGITAQPAQASGCWTYHYVRWGESLSWIGRYYGVDWRYLAQVNGIAPPFQVYAGQSLCIAGGGFVPVQYPNNGPSGRTWSFSIDEVVQNTSVTIRTNNFPSDVRFQVKMGFRGNGNAIDWKPLPDLDTGKGGSFKTTFGILPEFKDKTPLVMRLSEQKKNGNTFVQDQWFNNIPGGSGVGGPGPIYCPGCYNTCNIPTIWITSVQRDNTVTFQTNNFPPNVTFDVLMGPMHTQAIGGIYVGSFNSGAGGTFQQTFPIPPQLFGQPQIAIRTQNLGTGLFSYNWFFNNSTY
jgi:hypothetical protein